MEQVITIRAYSCTYRLIYPAFWLGAPKATLCKIFKWLFRFDLYPENQEAIEFFDRELPDMVKIVDAQSAEKISAAEKEWRARQADYKHDYLDPNPAMFPATWDKGHKQAEKERRKKWNADNLRRVKDAEARHRWAQKQAVKDHERAEMVYQIYLAEKG